MEDETKTPEDTQEHAEQLATESSAEIQEESNQATTDLTQVLKLLGALRQARTNATTESDEDLDDIPILTEVYGTEGNELITPATTLEPETTVENALSRDEIVTLLQEALAPLIEQEVKKVVQQELAVSEKILSKAIAKRFKDAMKANGLNEKSEH